MLLEHNIQDPLLLYLTYMEYSEQSGEQVAKPGVNVILVAWLT